MLTARRCWRIAMGGMIPGLSRSSGSDPTACSRLARAGARDAGGPVGRVAVLPARLGIYRQRKPSQHVHPDRARHRRRLRLQPGRHRSRTGDISPRRSGTRPPRSASAVYFEAAAVIVDPGARSARSWSCVPARPHRRRDPRAPRARAEDRPAGATPTGDEEDVPLDRDRRWAIASCVRPGERRSPWTASCWRAASSGRRDP